MSHESDREDLNNKMFSNIHNALDPQPQQAPAAASGSWMSILMRAEMQAHPETFTIDPTFAGAERRAAENRQLAAANAADRPKPSNHEEYDRLRKHHWELKEACKNSEIRVNNCAADIRNAEDKIGRLLKEKKSTDNPMHERHLERQIQVLEKELQGFREQYEKLRTDNKRAVANLKGFDTTRLQELAAELGLKKVS